MKAINIVHYKSLIILNSLEIQQKWNNKIRRTFCRDKDKSQAKLRVHTTSNLVCDLVYEANRELSITKVS